MTSKRRLRSEAIRIQRTLWYIGYRKWDNEGLQRVKDAGGLEQAILQSGDVPNGEAVERVALCLAKAKLPIDLVASAIERCYANDPDFDRDHYYGRDTWFPNDEGIDATGVEALRERRDELYELLGMSREELFHDARMDDGSDLPAILTVDGLFQKAKSMAREEMSF